MTLTSSLAGDVKRGVVHDMTTGPNLTEQPTAPSRGWWAVTAISLATFVTALDNTVVNVALPTMQRDLGLAVADLEWVHRLRL